MLLPCQGKKEGRGKICVRCWTWVSPATRHRLHCGEEALWRKPWRASPRSRAEPRRHLSGSALHQVAEGTFTRQAILLQYMSCMLCTECLSLHSITHSLWWGCGGGLMWWYAANARYVQGRAGGTWCGWFPAPPQSSGITALVRCLVHVLHHSSGIASFGLWFFRSFYLQAQMYNCFCLLHFI